MNHWFRYSCSYPQILPPSLTYVSFSAQPQPQSSRKIDVRSSKLFSTCASASRRACGEKVVEFSHPPIEKSYNLLIWHCYETSQQYDSIYTRFSTVILITWDNWMIIPSKWMSFHQVRLSRYRVYRRWCPLHLRGPKRFEALCWVGVDSLLLLVTIHTGTLLSHPARLLFCF